MSRKGLENDLGQHSTSETHFYVFFFYKKCYFQKKKSENFQFPAKCFVGTEREEVCGNLNFSQKFAISPKAAAPPESATM